MHEICIMWPYGEFCGISSWIQFFYSLQILEYEMWRQKNWMYISEVMIKAAALRIRIILRFLMCEADEVLHYLWSLMRTAYGTQAFWELRERDYVTQLLKQLSKWKCRRGWICYARKWLLDRYSAGSDIVWYWGAKLWFLTFLTVYIKWNEKLTQHKISFRLILLF